MTGKFVGLSPSLDDKLFFFFFFEGRHASERVAMGRYLPTVLPKKIDRTASPNGYGVGLPALTEG